MRATFSFISNVLANAQSDFLNSFLSYFLFFGTNAEHKLQRWSPIFPQKYAMNIFSQFLHSIAAHSLTCKPNASSLCDISSLPQAAFCNDSCHITSSANLCNAWKQTFSMMAPYCFFFMWHLKFARCCFLQRQQSHLGGEDIYPVYCIRLKLSDDWYRHQSFESLILILFPINSFFSGCVSGFYGMLDWGPGTLEQCERTLTFQMCNFMQLFVCNVLTFLNFQADIFLQH